MKVAIRDITSEGIEIDRNIEPAEIGLEEKDLDLKQPIALSVRIERVSDFVLVNSTVNATYEHTCARCLEPFLKNQTDQFNFEYEIQKGQEEVDYGEDIRQELILSRTQRELCRPDCRGLCLGCRVNLNLEVCKCKK